VQLEPGILSRIMEVVKDISQDNCCAIPLEHSALCHLSRKAVPDEALARWISKSRDATELLERRPEWQSASIADDESCSPSTASAVGFGVEVAGTYWKVQWICENRLCWQGSGYEHDE
jgi:hypothetical protein